MSYIMNSTGGMMGGLVAQPDYYGNYNNGPVMNYGQPVQMPKGTNPLGEATIKKLLAEGNGSPKLAVTQDDVNQAICTHRYNGATMAYPIDGGKVKCKICGAEFHIVDNASQEDIEKCAENLHDVMHTAKLMWYDVPEQTATELFQTLAVVDKVPDMFKIASNNFRKYGTNQVAYQSGPVGGFNMLNRIIGPSMPAYGYYNQQPMGQPMYPQQPVYGQQPYDPATGMMVQQPMYGQPMAPAYPQQAPYQTPQQAAMTANAPGMVNNGFGTYTDPNAMAQPVQQTPPATKPAEVTETVHVK
jgi:hypothetical protein